MNTATPAAAGTAEFPAVPAGSSSVRTRLGAVMPLARHLGFAVVVALSAVLNTYRLSRNGYANIFYSAGVKSMGRSLHNFLFVSFDPGGLINVDKAPLGLWVQAASAKLFGFSPLSLLLPEAIAGVLAVALLYLVLARRLGTVAAFAGAFALAVFPSFVAVSRDNGVDPLLILLMVLACGAGLRASETGRWRTLIWCGVLVGLAFNTKTLAAVLVVPGIALAYVVCAPGSVANRLLKLAVAGLAMVAVSFSWIAFVESTPASKRPYVGSSTNNTELGLTFEYNGFGRVEGQVGGPGQVVLRPGARVPAQHRRRAASKAAPTPTPPAAGGGTPAPTGPGTSNAAQSAAGSNPTFLPNGRYRNPIPFGSTPSPVRLFGKGLGDQAGWMIPFALFGLIALARIAVVVRRRPAAADADDGDGEGDGGSAGDAGPLPGRSDPRLATLLVLGGWFLVEAIVLSMSKGIVHPYYVSALGPATGAMAGAGAVALVSLRQGLSPVWGVVLAALAVLGTVAVEIVLLHREHYMLWLIPVLIGGGALGVGLLAAVRSLAAPALALTFCLLLVAPTAYATTTWLAPVEGTFPAAGPKAAAGDGGFGVSGRALEIDRALLSYVRSHRPGSRWELLTVASDSAAPFILLGLDAGALGGYSGTDPAVDGPRLAHLVSRGEARYVLLGGVYSTRGGNRATDAVLRACRQLRPSAWHSPDPYTGGLVLFDCAGRERALAAS
jgi:4-amino-4-deoxy-L-arabinose transferase-like glycosyltransferase